MVFDFMVSVVIPTYNSAHILEVSHGSVLKQTFKAREIVLEDDASQDNTLVMVEKFIKNNNLVNRFKYCRHEKNTGVAAAKNTGIKASCGEFISFLDADDIWLSNILECVMNIFHKFPEIDLVCHNELLSINGIIKKKLNYSKKTVKLNLNNKALVYKHLFLSNFLSTSAVTMKRYCLQNEIFDETLLVAEDYDLWLRLSRKYRFYFLDEFLGEYRKIETNALSNDVRRMCTGEVRVLNKNKINIGNIIFYKRIFVLYLRAVLKILRCGLLEVWH